MAALYGQRWTAAIPNDRALAEARAVWGGALNRLTDKQVRRGLGVCALTDGFPPSVGEFRRLAVGLPSADEAVSRLLRNEFDADPLVYEVCRRLGGNITKKMARKDLERAILREYRSICPGLIAEMEGSDEKWVSPAQIASGTVEKEAPARPEVAKKTHFGDEEGIAMNFEDALAEVKNGRRVRRTSWKNNNYIFLHEQKLTMRFGPSIENQYSPVFASDDVLSYDWELYHEGNNFSWALDQMKEDKIVRRLKVYWKVYAIREDTVRIYMSNGSWHNAVMDSESLLANDWILEEGEQP